MSETSTVFKFKAIDGSQFLGFLAGLGVCRALAAKYHAVKLSWNLGGAYPTPCLQTPEAITRGEVTEILLSFQKKWNSFGKGFPEDFARLHFKPDSYRQFATQLLSQPTEDVCWGSFAGAELAQLTRKGERRFVRSFYYLISARQTLTGIVEKVSEKITKERLNLLFDSQPGEIPLEDCLCLRFDPQEVEDHALRFADPADDEGTTNVAANYLAVIALPLLATFPSGKFVKCLCASRNGEDDGTSLRWQLWPDPVSLETALSIQRFPQSSTPQRSHVYEARVVIATRTYQRMLPAVRVR